MLVEEWHALRERCLLAMEIVWNEKTIARWSQNIPSDLYVYVTEYQWNVVEQSACYAMGFVVYKLDRDSIH